MFSLFSQKNNGKNKKKIVENYCIKWTNEKIADQIIAEYNHILQQLQFYQNKLISIPLFEYPIETVEYVKWMSSLRNRNIFSAVYTGHFVKTDEELKYFSDIFIGCYTEDDIILEIYTKIHNETDNTLIDKVLIYEWKLKSNQMNLFMDNSYNDQSIYDVKYLPLMMCDEETFFWKVKTPLSSDVLNKKYRIEFIYGTLSDTLRNKMMSQSYFFHNWNGVDDMIIKKGKVYNGHFPNVSIQDFIYF